MWRTLGLVNDIAATSLDAIVKAYDIRGTYPDQITAEVCEALGVGFAEYIGEVEPATTEFAIGRDMRPSGPELVEAFAAVLLIVD